MSTKDARNEARLINIAMAYISGTPDKRERLNVERQLVVSALSFTIEKMDAELEKLLLPNPRVLQSKPRKRKANTALAQKRAEERAAQKRAAVHAAEAAKAPKEVEEFESDLAARNAAWTAAGHAFQSVYETVKIGGRSVGKIWYSELESLRNRGAFEAALCQAILHHGKPAKDAQVKDLITEAVLAKFVADANRAVNRVKAAA